MSHYKPNLRDVEFNLFELLDRGRILGSGPYEEIDRETASDVLAQVARLATDKLAPSLLSSDRTPPTFEAATHTVTLTEDFKDSYRAFADSEFWRMGMQPALGGQPVPPSLRWAIGEFILGANPAVHM